MSYMICLQLSSRSSSSRSRSPPRAAVRSSAYVSSSWPKVFTDALGIRLETLRRQLEKPLDFAAAFRSSSIFFHILTDEMCCDELYFKCI